MLATVGGAAIAAGALSAAGWLDQEAPGVLPVSAMMTSRSWASSAARAERGRASQA